MRLSIRVGIEAGVVVAIALLITVILLGPVKDLNPEARLVETWLDAECGRNILFLRQNIWPAGKTSDEITRLLSDILSSPDFSSCFGVPDYPTIRSYPPDAAVDTAIEQITRVPVTFFSGDLGYGRKNARSREILVYKLKAGGLKVLPDYIQPGS